MLAVQDLSFAYRKGAEELFGGLEYAFRPGAMTAITGPSGRGKSTLLYVLGLMLTPTAGQVLLGGEPVSALPDWQRSRLRATRIGFVFQDAALDPSRTILDSVREPALYAGGTPAQIEGRARELMDQMGVAARADHRPGEISGGQAQRVAVCRALITDPAVVLADEPTGNLDRANAEEVLGALSEATGGSRTVVIATHDPFVIEHADEVLAL
ncbi:ABC transporter ATP-binding protein [Tessaracoccus caeni]|uniref:ABC transporter ATP-binding protein n=1 Tax=Tessaracoccus caeni TaxID=3031239 RepID=UPI0023DB3272|nr:ABC transporter ATP-binding protein [Tessaracoccus caeni]MDF1486825.1 ABC transporter ATP-binding protein [Tessaracoccus caeni]